MAPRQPPMASKETCNEGGAEKLDTWELHKPLRSKMEVWGSRGCHVVTRQIVTAVPELKHFQVGIAHLFGEASHPFIHTCMRTHMLSRSGRP